MSSQFKIRQARRIIEAGGVIAHPTEAVYGLACNPANSSAVWRVLRLKQRSPEKGLILVASNLAQLEPYILLSDILREKVTQSWPGPVTWLIPARSGISSLLTGAHSTLAVRVSAHPVVQALCKECNHPLISTSANRQSSPPARSAFAVRRIFKQELDFVLQGDVDLAASPTEIRDATTGKIIRSS